MKRHHIINHPGARTRALYRWELEEIFFNRRNARMTLVEARKFAVDFWRTEGRTGERVPRVEFTFNGDDSYALGRGDIVLHAIDNGPVILVHELVHTKGFGQGRSVHPVSFVREYIRCLAYFAGYNLRELTDSAMMRGLI